MPCCLEEGQWAKGLLKVFLNARSFYNHSARKCHLWVKKSQLHTARGELQDPDSDKCPGFSDWLLLLVMKQSFLSLVPETSVTNTSKYLGDSLPRLSESWSHVLILCHYHEHLEEIKETAFTVSQWAAIDMGELKILSLSGTGRLEWGLSQCPASYDTHFCASLVQSQRD